MSDLVDDLLPDAVGEHVDRGSCRDAAVGGSAEAVCRDHGAVAVEVREAEHVVPATVVQIARGDTDVLFAAADAADGLN